MTRRAPGRRPGRIAPPHGPATHLTASRRRHELEDLASGRAIDVLVVGGGVTGAGAALDASARGLSVALLERRDLAMGTSRFSSKLAHGGLRYLAQGRLDVAWESARERALLLDVIAPHLVRALPQLTPSFGRLRPASAAALELGLRIGDCMRALSGTSRRRLPRARRIGAAEALLWAPALRRDGLRGAILSWDGQLEDDARLVIALARTAAAHGARVVTYAEVTALTPRGAQARDLVGGERFEVRARHTINATGVWAGRLADGVRLRPSKGSHLLVGADRLGSPRAMVNVPVAGARGRFVFAVPRPDRTVMIGITDEPFAGEPPDAPAVSATEETFLLRTISRALERELTAADVIGRFAGLRPLLDDGPDPGSAPQGGAGPPRAHTADLSRRHAVIENESTGAVTVVGGKLTTYRRMAQDAVDLIAARPGVRAAPCRTHRLSLVGAQAPDAHAPAGTPERLVRRFGAEAGEVAALARTRPELLEPIAPGVPALGVELVAAVEREGALTVEDALDRRMRLGLVPAWRHAAAARVGEIAPGLARAPAHAAPAAEGAVAEGAVAEDGAPEGAVTGGAL